MNRLEQMKERGKKWKASKKLKAKMQQIKQEKKDTIVSEQRKKQYMKISRLFHACGDLSEELAKK